MSKTPCRFVTNDTVIAGSVGGEVRRLGEAAVDEVESWARTGTFRTPVHPETLARAWRTKACVNGKAHVDAV